MEFRTKLVVKRRNRKAYIAYGGLAVTAIAVVMALIPAMQDYYAYAFGGGLAIVVIGAVIARGDVTNYGLSEEELAVSENRIEISGRLYPLNQVSKMNFNVEAFAGRYMNDGAMISGTSSDGMTNELSFEFGGKTIDCVFFLSNKEHVLQLGAVFDQFYQRRIPFIERNKSTRTYLFQILTDPQIEEFKRAYGYI